MSRVTTYKCDRCGKESTELEEIKLAIVGIGVKENRYDSYHPGAYSLWDEAKREMEMCRECREELGINQPTKKEPEAEPPKYPTLEEMIREIVREEISSQ